MREKINNHRVKKKGDMTQEKGEGTGLPFQTKKERKGTRRTVYEIELRPVIR